MNLRKRGVTGGIMGVVLGSCLKINEFELQLRYYINFRINTLGKGMNSLILTYPPSNYDLNCTIANLLKGYIWQ